MNTVTEVITDIMTRWLAWVDAGAPESTTFSRRDSLCIVVTGELAELEKKVIITQDMADVACEVFTEHMGELVKAKRAAGEEVSGASPFLPKGKNLATWLEERSTRQCHANASRVQWVRDYLAGKYLLPEPQQ